MAVSAIHAAGLSPAASPDLKGHQGPIPSLDFAAMLAAFDGSDAGGGASSPAIEPAPAPSAFAAEAFRSSTFAGHGRLTTIVYGDGTSETRLDEMGADDGFARALQPVRNGTVARFAIGEWRDPGQALDMAGGVARSAARRRIAGGRARSTVRGMSDGQADLAAPRRLACITSDAPGRVIDLFA